MSVSYPCWLYSDLNPPQLVTSAAQQAALPADYSITPSSNAMVLPSAVAVTAEPIVVATVTPSPPAPAVIVKSPKHQHELGRG